MEKINYTREKLEECLSFCLTTKVFQSLSEETRLPKICDIAANKIITEYYFDERWEYLFSMKYVVIIFSAIHDLNVKGYFEFKE